MVSNYDGRDVWQSQETPTVSGRKGKKCDVAQMRCAGKVTEQKQITAPAGFVTLFALRIEFFSPLIN